jgi:hypothetical protein
VVIWKSFNLRKQVRAAGPDANTYERINGAVRGNVY